MGTHMPYGNTHAIWDHTVAPATRQRWHSRRYPSRSWYSIKWPRRDARLSWPSWLITARDGIWSGQNGHYCLESWAATGNTSTLWALENMPQLPCIFRCGVTITRSRTSEWAVTTSRPYTRMADVYKNCEDDRSSRSLTRYRFPCSHLSAFHHKIFHILFHN